MLFPNYFTLFSKFTPQQFVFIFILFFAVLFYSQVTYVIYILVNVMYFPLVTAYSISYYFGASDAMLYSLILVYDLILVLTGVRIFGVFKGN